MAGSLAHIIGNDGKFTMDLIENLGDAHEALSECFHIILRLTDGQDFRVSQVCDDLGYPDPYENDGEPIPFPMQKTPGD